MALDLFTKKKKCPICEEKYDELTHEIRLNTSEGMMKLDICYNCADFFDKSAQVLQQARKEDTDGEDESV